MSINLKKDIAMSLLIQFGGNSVERVNHACHALSQGRGIILIDDEDRENEGDLIFSAAHITTHDVARMINDCSGIICLCLTEEKAQQLSLSPMVTTNTSQYQTAFTVSIEARDGVTTGVSAQDRWTTIRAAIQENASALNLRQPGHVFPLIARDGGVMVRRGHTEGSIDLLKMAGLLPCAVLCELMNPDGTMKKLHQLIDYSESYQFPMVSVEDIYQVRCDKPC
jgi:3,4-dihydroxy 2-butanone 4-phosphate synthase